MRVPAIGKTSDPLPLADKLSKALEALAITDESVADAISLARDSLAAAIADEGIVVEEDSGKLIIGADEVDSTIVELPSDTVGRGTMMLVSDVDEASLELLELEATEELLDSSSESALERDEDIELAIELAAGDVEEAPRVIVERVAPGEGAC